MNRRSPHRAAGRRPGRTVALTIAALACAALITASCTATTKYSKLVVGECLPSNAEVVGRREPDPPRVSCVGPHRFEVYWTAPIDLGSPKVTAPGVTYPGDARVDAASKAQCAQVFEAGVGIAPLDLPDGVKMLYLAPSEQSWVDGGDRDVECLVVFDADRSGRFVRTGRL